jgi:hypothetical protein
VLFRKKRDVDDYCAASLKVLFSSNREKVWEQLRHACSDPALSGIDRTVYFNHIRAIMIELVLIAIAKTFNMDIGSDAHIFILTYCREHGISHIDDIRGTYSQAFGGIAQDGVAAMVASFSGQLTNGQLRQDTMERLYVEFYAVLKGLFDDFKSIKLTTKRG